jgi:acetoin:2,6-dichlorophenolindophenol oxidoreductase subunit beta
MQNKREITYAQAIREAFDQSLAKDKRVFIIGEGVPDLKGIFGTTLDLVKKYGSNRVMDMPVSENGLTGICIGAALAGMRPILNHQRVDFSLLSADQIINNAAKWYTMFGQQAYVPLVIRMIVGRGWGQGAQHSQSLQALFAHIPGLNVVMPATAYDAKGMLLCAIHTSKNPIIYIDHRWLHYTKGIVEEKYYETPLTGAAVVKKGRDVTLVCSSFMLVESLRAQELLKKAGVSVEIVDLRSISPIDTKTIITSIAKTGKLLVADTGYTSFGVASEIISLMSELAFSYLKAPPVKVALPDIPSPTSYKLVQDYYPTFISIMSEILTMLKFPPHKIEDILQKAKKTITVPCDVPDNTFTGPF